MIAKNLKKKEKPAATAAAAAEIFLCIQYGDRHISQPAWPF